MEKFINKKWSKFLIILFFLLIPISNGKFNIFNGVVVCFSYLSLTQEYFFTIKNMFFLLIVSISFFYMFSKFVKNVKIGFILSVFYLIPEIIEYKKNNVIFYLSFFLYLLFVILYIKLKHEKSKS